MASTTGFYDPTVPDDDPLRQMFLTILDYRVHELEYNHDYIQYLFPLPERSPVNPTAWTINRETFDAFRARVDLRNELRKSLALMASFYGFDVISEEKYDGKLRIRPCLDDSAFNIHRRAGNWVKPFDHNHLRISRIIRCLRVLGLEEDARAFYDAIKEMARRSGNNSTRNASSAEAQSSVEDEWAKVDLSEYVGISTRSQMYWARAMERPLWMPPDMDEALPENRRKGWLWEWERDENPSHH